MLNKRFGEPIFDESAHSYHYVSDGVLKSLRSVSSIVDTHSGETLEQLAEKLLPFNKGWGTIEEATQYIGQRMNDKAKVGHLVHDAISYYLSNGSNTSLCDKADDESFNKIFTDNKYFNKIFDALLTELDRPIEYRAVEQMFFNPHYGLSGAVDYLYFDTELCKWVIVDWKTSKRPSEGEAGNLMLYPFDDLVNNRFNRYRIQLSLYRLLAVTNGNDVSELMHLGYITPTGILKFIPVNYYPKVEQLFLDF